MKYVQVCQALYDYESRTPDELTIRENDILYVLEKEDEDWWRAELKQHSDEAPGLVGLVPASYLTECRSIGKVYAEYSYTAQQEEELTFDEGDEMDLLERDDPDWYLVKLKNGLIGLVPSNYVQSFEPTANAEQQQAHPVVEPSVPPPARETVDNRASPTVTEDDAQSWTVHEYDQAKKKKKKGKGNILIGNGMICYGSETDKALPVQQYPILDVSKYLFDGKNLHIEISGTKSAVFDLQASSKSEAKAILVKITDSRKVAQAAATRVNPHSNQATERTEAYTSESNGSNEPIQTEPSIPAEEEATVQPKWAIILYSFDAESDEELTVHENEQVMVLNSARADGWWQVENINGQSGIVPSSYVQFHEDYNTSTSDVDVSRGTEAQRQQSEEEEQERESQRIEEQERLRLEKIRHKEEQQQRDEEERERRKKIQEAAQRAEAARQRQIEESYRRKEAQRRASVAQQTSVSSQSLDYDSHGPLSRSLSVHTELTKPNREKVRTWTDRSGAFKVDAEFLSYYDGKLRLHKLNGVKIDVPLEKMSIDDIRWVEKSTGRNILKEKEATTKIESATEKTPPMPRRPEPARSSVPPPKEEKKINLNWDWFDWFMLIGIPMESALIYASAFKADKLDDSDITKLTHKQMKTLGVKEKHVRRIERYIETENPEPPSDEENEATQRNSDDKQKQISADEELAKKLQRDWNQSPSSPTKVTRAKPAVSAPKEVHPDLLEFIGTKFTSEPGSIDEAPKNKQNPTSSDLIGFEDDAWTPRPVSKAAQSRSPNVEVATTAAVSPPSPPPPPTASSASAQTILQATQPTGSLATRPSTVSAGTAPPEQRPVSALRQTADPPVAQQSTGPVQPSAVNQPSQYQIQEFDHTGISNYTTLPSQQISVPQRAQTAPYPVVGSSIMQSGSPSATVAVQQQPLTTGLVHQHTNQAAQWQLQQQQLQLQQLQQEQQLQQQQIQHQQLQQQQLQLQLQLQQQQQQQIQVQPTGYSQPWQAHQLQPQMTGHSNTLQTQQMAGPTTSANTYQTAAVPFTSMQQPSLITSSAAGQQPFQPSTMTGYSGYSNMQRSNTISGTIAAQPTGMRNWQSATPQNPFGSPTISPLNPQITGLQYSTPNMNAFVKDPTIQPQPNFLQPQMTGIPQQQGVAASR
ncbi:cytoskeletal protein binding protein [Apophysomyces ossiformis]|uniref:Actin cytoskeleton-regulatory complex protein SLA1 n=1 Tax=Apophysomyces ossiformis TaxID=679940 RepID=A0A8H7BL09_9FUNG|nr:cytoskeletal protein binding protein [Apophysomyces ossiformis]